MIKFDFVSPEFGIYISFLWKVSLKHFNEFQVFFFVFVTVQYKTSILHYDMIMMTYRAVLMTFPHWVISDIFSR